MKVKPLFVITLVTALTCAASTANAAGKGNKKGGNKTNPNKVAPATDDPIASLQPFIQNLDQLLALERNGNKSFEAFATQAPGRLAIMSSQLAAQRVAAQQPEQPRLDAAIATCDAIARSLDERQQTIAQMTASSAVKAPSGGGPRKDNPGILQYDRELREARQGRKDARETDRTFDATARNRWTQRSIHLRQQIQTAYARIAATGSAPPNGTN